MFSRLFVVLNNSLTRLRRVQVASENLLLLVPRCLQKNGCSQTLGEIIDDCNSCGQCGVTDLHFQPYLNHHKDILKEHMTF